MVIDETDTGARTNQMPLIGSDWVDGSVSVGGRKNCWAVDPAAAIHHRPLLGPARLMRLSHGQVPARASSSSSPSSSSSSSSSASPAAAAASIVEPENEASLADD